MQVNYQKQILRTINRLRQLYLSAQLVISILLMGTIGYCYIEGYDLMSAIYMTVITITTVGYSEIKPLSSAGRIFTIILLINSIGIFTYALSVFSSFILEGNLNKVWKDVNVYRKMKKLKNHTIVCGYGRYGSEICQHLLLHQTPFIVIEQAESKIELIQQNSQLLYLQGDASQDELLKEAGIAEASTLVCTLPHDADNVYVTLTARQLNPNLRIISRAVAENSELKLRKAGANEVIQPEKIGGFYMSMLINKPDVVSFFRLLSNESATNISFEEIILDKPIVSKVYCVRQLQNEANLHINIIGIKLPNGNYIINPDPELQLESGMSLIILGNLKNLNAFKNYWLRESGGYFKFIE